VLFFRLKNRSIKVTHSVLDDFTYLWNYCNQVVWQNRNILADLSGLSFTTHMLKRFKLEKQNFDRWIFWYIQGVLRLLHAYLREEMLSFEGPNSQKKLLKHLYLTAEKNQLRSWSPLFLIEYERDITTAVNAIK
jgi:hypothetical protein